MGLLVDLSSERKICLPAVRNGCVSQSALNGCAVDGTWLMTRSKKAARIIKLNALLEAELGEF